MATALLAGGVALAGCTDGSNPRDAAAPVAGSTRSHAGAASIYASVAAELGLSGRDPDAMSAAELAAHATAIERIVAASSDDHCDFGVDYRLGPLAEMPHLAEQRQLARLLRADAKRLADAGDLEGAARRTAAIVRVASQVGTGKAMIERIVAISIVLTATELVAERPRLREAAWRTDILAAFAEFRRDFLAAAPDFFAEEAAILGAWLRRATDAEMREIAEDGMLYRNASARAAAADTLDRYSAAITEAWRTRGGTAEIERLNERSKSDLIFDLVAGVVPLRRAVERVTADISAAERALR